MATLREAPVQDDLNTVSIRSIDGLTSVDLWELQRLGYGSLESLVQAMIDHSGDLIQIGSVIHAVIEESQSERIGDAVLAYMRGTYPDHDRTEDLKNFDLSSQTDEEVEEEEAEETEDRDQRGPLDLFLDGLLNREVN